MSIDDASTGFGIGRAAERDAVLRLDPAHLRDGHAALLSYGRARDRRVVGRPDYRAGPSATVPRGRRRTRDDVGVFTDPGRVNLRKAARAAIVTPALFAIFDVGARRRGHRAVRRVRLVRGAGVLRLRRRAARHGRRAYAAVLRRRRGARGARHRAAPDSDRGRVAAMAVVAFVVVFLGALGGYFSASAITRDPGVRPRGRCSRRRLGQVWEREVGLDRRRRGRRRQRARALAGRRAGPRAARRGRPRRRRWPTQLERPGGDAAAALGGRARRARRERRDGVPSRRECDPRPRAGLAGARAAPRARLRSELPMTRSRRRPRRCSPRARRCCARSPRASGRPPRSSTSSAARARRARRTPRSSWRGRAARRPAPTRPASSHASTASSRCARCRCGCSRSRPTRRRTSGVALTGVDAAVDAAPADLRFFATPVARRGAVRRLADHWNLDSVRLRAALRTALGLAVAVGDRRRRSTSTTRSGSCSARSACLRSNAFGTGVTAVQAVAGDAHRLRRRHRRDHSSSAATPPRSGSRCRSPCSSRRTRPARCTSSSGRRRSRCSSSCCSTSSSRWGGAPGSCASRTSRSASASASSSVLLLWPRGARAAAAQTFERHAAHVAAPRSAASLDHLVAALDPDAAGRARRRRRRRRADGRDRGA